jgi:hypothetical protein
MDMAPTPRPTVNRPPMTVDERTSISDKNDLHMGRVVEAVMMAAPRRKKIQLSKRHFCRPI